MMSAMPFVDTYNCEMFVVFALSCPCGGLRHAWLVVVQGTTCCISEAVSECFNLIVTQFYNLGSMYSQPSGMDRRLVAWARVLMLR